MLAALIRGYLEASKINYFAAMAPVAHVSHSGSLLLQIASKTHLAALVSDVGFGEFLPSDKLLETLLPDFCHEAGVVCDDVLELLCGPSHFINQTRSKSRSACKLNMFILT
jgi:hypothetical protein